MPIIFLEDSRHAEWQALLSHKDPTAVSLLRALQRQAGVDNGLQTPAPMPVEEDPEYQAIAEIILGWLERARGLTETGLLKLLPLLVEPPRSDLGAAARALAGVIAWDFSEGIAPARMREQLAEALAYRARGFLQVNVGNPHTVTNNWWMLTHGACLLACIAVDGEHGTQGRIDLADLKEWALGRFEAFCAHFGPAGLYHEGLGYMAYTLSSLMPALYAVRRHLKPDILEQFPQLAHSIPSLLAATSAFGHTDNGCDHNIFGACLQWNDAGRGAPALNPVITGMRLAPPQQLGALRWVFDRLLGIKGRNTWECPYRGIGLAVALYPFSTEPVAPEGILPNSVFDSKQGMGIWRSGWSNGQESVLGWYARACHPGGHAQDDAASVRLMGFGRTWICGGGQARPAAAFQSVLTHADPAARPQQAALAHPFSVRQGAESGIVGMDTRRSLGAYSERYIAWRKDCGRPLCLALLDLVDDHRDPPPQWQWNLSFPRELRAELHPDGAGFSFLDPDSGRLDARFLLDRPDELSLAEMPGSRRTFANGNVVDYPGDRYICARFAKRRQLKILCLLALGPRGTRQAQLKVEGRNLNVDSAIWEHPFHPAILKTAELADMRPNLMRYPAGTPVHQA